MAAQRARRVVKVNLRLDSGETLESARRGLNARGLDTFVNREIKVKLTDRGGGVEHVWVRVERATGDQFVGTILNKPVGKHFPPLAPGQRVRMMARDVSALSENDDMGCACA